MNAPAGGEQPGGGPRPPGACDGTDSSEQATRLAEALLATTAAFRHQLPEVVAGFERDRSIAPVRSASVGRLRAAARAPDTART
jgi:hypothetical protein